MSAGLKTKLTPFFLFIYLLTHRNEINYLSVYVTEILVKQYFAKKTRPDQFKIHQIFSICLSTTTISYAALTKFMSVYFFKWPVMLSQKYDFGLMLSYEIKYFARIFASLAILFTSFEECLSATI